MTTLPRFIEDILFVIVLYKIKPDQSPAFVGVTELAKNLAMPVSIFMYDNSPEQTIVDHPVIYRHDPANGGVSKAYNEAFAEAIRLKKKWMLLLDQDTQFASDFIHKLFEATHHHSSSMAFVPKLCDRNGLVSPFRWSMGGGRRAIAIKNKLPLKNFRFMNSGLLIKCEGFQMAGGYPETIPLDFSDIAFGEKLRKFTDHFIVMPVVLRHFFSASEKINWDAALHRYHYFCVGAFGMGKTFGPYLLYFIRAFLRGLNLSVQYKNSAFLKTFYASLKW